MDYPKINSLWKRAGDHSFIVGDYSCAEFALINNWRVEEKIDGTNIVVHYLDTTVSYQGRTQNAAIPPFLVAYLENHVTSELMSTVFPENKSVVLFGEGYGGRIQASGPSYRDDVGFMLFDALVDGLWQTREELARIGDQLNLPVPPQLGVMTEAEIVDLVKSKPLSRCSIKPQAIEGVVVRSEPLLLFRNGNPLTWKLKVRDFYRKKEKSSMYASAY